MDSKKGILVALCSAVFSSMLGMGIIAPLLPIYAKTMGATGVELGLVFAAFSITRTVGIPIIGRASDKYGKKLFLSMGMLVYTLMSIGYVVSENVLELLIVRVLQGLASGMIIPIATAYIGDIAPIGSEGRYMGLFNTFFFAGFGAGPIIGGVISDAFGMDFAFYSMGGLNLIALILAVSMLPKSEIFGQRTIARTSYYLMVKESGVTRGLFSFRLSFAIGRSIFSCFLPILGGLYLGLLSSEIGILISINILLNSMLQVLGGRLADKFSRRKLVVSGTIIDVCCFLLIPLMHSFNQLLVICVISAVARLSSVPSVSALAIEEGRKYGMGSSMGIFQMAMSIGQAVGPLIGGGITDNIGVKWTFIFAAFIELVGILLFAKFSHANLKNK